MENNNHSYTFFFTCQRGIEDELQKEINEITNSEIDSSPAFCGVKAVLSIPLAVKVLINTTMANRIYLKIDEFEFTRNSEIPEQIAKIDWNDYFNVSKSIGIKTSFGEIQSKFADQFKSPFFISQLTKDGINQYFENKNKKRITIENKNPDLKVYQFVEGITKTRFKFIIYVDFVGKNLGERGYRLPRQKAPLRETLAGYLVRKMQLQPENHFLDAMAGSGTMVMEYLIHRYNLGGQYLAILNQNLNFDFEKLSFYRKNRELPEQVKEIIKRKEKHIGKKLKEITQDNHIWANDMDPKCIRDIVQALKLSLLSPNLKTSKQDALQIRPDVNSKNYKVFYNPPYGKRIGEEEHLADLYYQIGENHKQNYPDSEFYIIAPEKEFVKKIRLKPFLKDRIFHGGLECYFYGYSIDAKT
ncbi:hypothetical protein N9N67_07905 [Bacteriovoracaceae bacterium]|nr:hypothetical protein [Bacteriovoracaceae bacterium]